MKTNNSNLSFSLPFRLLILLGIVFLGWPPKVSPQAWKNDWEKTLAAAKKEGKVVVAGGVGESYRNALTAFRNSYPDIQLDYLGAQGRDFAPRIVQERRVGQFLWDIHIGGSSSMLNVMMPQGAVDPLQPALILPEASDDSKWRNGFKDGWMDREENVYGFSGSIFYGVFINRDFASETDIGKAEDLWNPRWKDKIVWHDPRAGGTGSHQALMVLLQFGEEALKRLLRDQQPVLTTDYRQQVEWMAQGRYPIGIGLHETFLRPFQKEGVGKNIKPLQDNRFILFVGSFGHVALINRAPHPNAAKVYINWLLSKEGQTAWAKFTGENSRRLDVPAGDPERLAKPGTEHLNTQKQEYAEKVQKLVFPIVREVLK